jgi:hypothetical protein
MNQIIKAKIDGVPVEIEIIRMGPATINEIKNLESNLSKEDSSFVLGPIQQMKVTKIGNENYVATPADIEKVKAAIRSGNKDAISLIEDLVTSINQVPAGKDFWMSKVVWINFLAILTAIFAYFGIDLKQYNLDPDTCITIVSVITAMANLYFRKGTDKPLNSILTSLKKLKGC